MGSPVRVPTGHVFRVERARGLVWYAKYRLPDGRQVQRKVGPAWSERGRPPAGYFTTRLAEAWLRDVLDQARRGTLASSVRTGATFADAAAEWLRYIEHDRGRKPSTVEGYRSIVRSELLPAFWSDGARGGDAGRDRVLAGVNDAGGEHPDEGAGWRCWLRARRGAVPGGCLHRVAYRGAAGAALARRGLRRKCGARPRELLRRPPCRSRARSGLCPWRRMSRQRWLGWEAASTGPATTTSCSRAWAATTLTVRRCGVATRKHCAAPACGRCGSMICATRSDILSTDFAWSACLLLVGVVRGRGPSDRSRCRAGAQGDARRIRDDGTELAGGWGVRS